MQRFNVEQLLSSAMRRRQFLIGAGTVPGLRLPISFPEKLMLNQNFLHIHLVWVLHQEIHCPRAWFCGRGLHQSL